MGELSPPVRSCGSSISSSDSKAGRSDSGAVEKVRGDPPKHPRDARARRHRPPSGWRGVGEPTGSCGGLAAVVGAAESSGRTWAWKRVGVSLGLMRPPVGTQPSERPSSAPFAGVFLHSSSGPKRARRKWVPASIKAGGERTAETLQSRLRPISDRFRRCSERTRLRSDAWIAKPGSTIQCGKTTVRGPNRF